MALVLTGASLVVLVLAGYSLRAVRRKKHQHTRQSEVAESLLRQLVVSLSLRDWEDSHIGQAMTERKSLSERIVGIGDPAADPLIRLLAHPDWGVRDDAARMLGDLKCKRAIEPLVALQERDGSGAVRASARIALRLIRGMPDFT